MDLSLCKCGHFRFMHRDRKECQASVNGGPCGCQSYEHDGWKEAKT